MSSSLPEIIQSLQKRFPAAVLDTKLFRGETTLIIKRENIREVCRLLKSDLGFLFLVDITAVDYLGIKAPRYEVIYHVHRFGSDFDENLRLRLKVEIPEDDATVDSVTPAWSGADWLEREAYDMFGIEFLGHPDPRRILMPEDFEPFPLRKDFDVRNREPSRKSFERALDEG